MGGTQNKKQKQDDSAAAKILKDNDAKRLGHNVAVDTGLTAGEAALEQGGKAIGKVLPKAGRVLGGAGKVLGFKLFGKIPVIGPLIDLFHSSESIVSGKEEKRMLDEARKQRAAEEKAREPHVEQGIQHEDGTIYWPESREWEFAPDVVHYSKKRARGKLRRKTTKAESNAEPNDLSASQESAWNGLSEGTRKEIMDKGVYVPEVWGEKIPDNDYCSRGR